MFHRNIIAMVNAHTNVADTSISPQGIPSEGKVGEEAEDQCPPPTTGHCSYSGGHSTEQEHLRGHSSAPDEPKIRPFPSATNNTTLF